jgi:hypothetical protein
VREAFELGLADGIVERLGFRLAPADRLADAGAIAVASQLVASLRVHVTSFLMTSHASAMQARRLCCAPCPKLTVLNMAENAITGAAVPPEGSDVGAALAVACGPAKTHRPLLQYNPLGDAGARALVAAVGASPFSKQLQALKLGGCALSDAGAQAIAEVLAAQQLRYLTDLDL